MGYSATDPIGTKHIGECVAVIARDPANGTIACAHVDQHSSQASLARVLDGLSQGPLDIMLLGARFAPGDDPDRAAIAMHNLSKVMDVLGRRRDNIVAAQVQDINQPFQIYIHPRTGQVSLDALEYPDPHAGLAFAKMILTGGRDGIDLETAFDLRQSQDRNPVLLRETEVAVLNTRINGRTQHEIADWFRTLPGFRDEEGWTRSCVDLAEGWNKIYQKSLQDLAKAVGKNADDLRAMPLYIGEGSLASNIAALSAAEEKPALHQAPVLKP